MLKKREEKVADVKDFFVDILRNLHEKAQIYGFAEGGMIYVKELLSFGQEYLLRILNDTAFQKKFGLDAVSYYFNIACKTFCAGVWSADYWHKNEQKPTMDVASEYIMNCDPYTLALVALDEKKRDALDDFLSKIYNDWLEDMDAYWDMSDSRNYIFHGLLVFYQLGISERLKVFSQNDNVSAKQKD